eukprot:scaffold97254_cov61-Phaeocystis_antarctica.AAC.5
MRGEIQSASLTSRRIISTYIPTRLPPIFVSRTQRLLVNLQGLIAQSGFGTRPRDRRARLSLPEHRTAPHPLEVRGRLLELRCERGPASQEPYLLSTAARMKLASTPFGAALTTLTDSALSSSSFHHSGLATSAHSSFSKSKAAAVACAQSSSDSTGARSLASRYRCTASTLCPESSSTAPRLKYASGLSGRRAMASR